MTFFLACWKWRSPGWVITWLGLNSLLRFCFHAFNLNIKLPLKFTIINKLLFVVFMFYLMCINSQRYYVLQKCSNRVEYTELLKHYISSLSAALGKWKSHVRALCAMEGKSASSRKSSFTSTHSWLRNTVVYTISSQPNKTLQPGQYYSRLLSPFNSEIV